MEKIKEFFSKIQLNKKTILKILIIIFAILVIYFIISSIVNGNKNRNCNSLREQIIAKADAYVENNNLWPNLNGSAVTINLSDLGENITFKDKTISGSITYTKYNDSYVKTVIMDNADYCSTGNFGKEKDQYDDSKNVKVNAYFNYVTVDSYNSRWSNWYPSEDISEELTDGVLLPIDEDDLPNVPNNAVITEYVRETKTYYSYRDKKWRWYRNNIDYSDFSSERPAGYTNKDTSVKLTTEDSPWSLDYPTEYDYRHISSKTGYRWYYLVDGEKVYWNNGEYSPDSPGDEYKRDTEFSARMYSYYDDMWRWYNGDTRRIYSNSSSTQPTGYNYKDGETLTYTSWSRFTDTSSLNSSNSSYREERTDIYSRYLIKYDIYSYPILENNVTLSELEQKLGKTYEELSKDDSIKIEVTFKFQYE